MLILCYFFRQLSSVKRLASMLFQNICSDASRGENKSQNEKKVHRLKIKCAPAHAIFLVYYVLQYNSISEIYSGSVFVLMTLAASRLPASVDLFRLLKIFQKFEPRSGPTQYWS